MPSQSKNINLRNRKLLQDHERERRPPALRKKSEKASAKKSTNGLIFSFICLVASMTILILFFGFYTDSLHPIVDTIAGHFGYSEKQYAVIFDAGSTGSRVLAYEFHKAYLDGRLVLDKELFKQSKPGLSSYADDPLKGAQSIDKLLDEARKVIPEAFWKSTPLALKATAGLRLLGSEQADALLDAVRELFKKSGFLVAEKSVEIMDGTDEGIFSWFTVNILLGLINTKNTIAALDLGGGSTQVTYAPKDISKTPLYKDYIHTVPTFNSEVNVFTNSYLNLGLMAVRQAVLVNGGNSNQTSLESECVNQIIRNKTFKYANVDYQISGKENKKSPENPQVDYEMCLSIVRKHVLPLVTPKPITLNQHQISAFSYFYDRAIETGLVDPYEGGEIAVSEIVKKGREVCSIANTEQPFMCLDLVFISVLLEDGYGLQPKTPIKLYKKIKGHEISWALGCAYNILLSNTN